MRGIYSFKKTERLCSKKLIDELFSKGQTLTKFPLKLIYLETTYEEKIALKVGFSVPKKFHKKSVDRNLIKRRMREAYRLNKNEKLKILNQAEKQYALFFIYLSKEKLVFSDIQDKTIFLLDRLLHTVSPVNS